MKYYAVKIGKKPGIYNSWDECKEMTIGYPNALYKSFQSLEDAKSYLDDLIITKFNPSNVVAYVDGSYNVKTEEYSFGAILIVNNEIKSFKKKFEKDEYSSTRNVAGEIRGASFIINYALKQGYKEIDLYHDYVGIKEFYTGAWACNTKLTKLYNDFANSVKDKIKVNFYKVKSHTNDYYNDLVDSLAKEALGIK